MFESFPNDFQWGSLGEKDINFIISEYCAYNTYECWRNINEGDVVVDIGSSVGPFCYSALNNGAKKVYCIEPSRELIEINLKNNFKFMLNKNDPPIVYINKAVDYETRNDIQESLDGNYTNVFGESKYFTTITFKDFIDTYQVDKINFLKIDCEGGEYSILTEDNFEYLTNNVDFIACEIHNKCFPYPIGIDNFKKFRDTFLSKIPREKYKITCIVDKVLSDVTDWICTDYGCEHILKDTEVMIYIKNR